MESFIPSNADEPLHVVGFPEDGVGYFDMDKVDPSSIIVDEKDKMYAITSDHLDRLKQVSEMNIA